MAGGESIARAGPGRAVSGSLGATDMNFHDRAFGSAPRLALCLCLAALHAWGADDPTPRQGAALLKADILGVFAHPDDETGMAATLAHYALGEGKVVAHAYATRGEGGGNMVGTQAGAALAVLREAELRDCLRILGVRFCYFLEQTDFFYTESHAATLRKWDREEALRRLVRLVRALRPEVIVTMNPAPNPGQHGHHQAAGVLATEAFAAAANPAAFPEQLAEEGLHPWQARKLFYGGAAGLNVTTISTTQPLADGRIPADVAGEALSQHRSQAFGGFVRSPWLRRPQAFTLVKSVVPPEPNPSDLFAGLPTTEPVSLVSFAPARLPELIRFQPRPAIRAYVRWAEQQGISHVNPAFGADLPVVVGERNSVTLEMPDPKAAQGLREALQFEASPGWRILSVGEVTRGSRGGGALLQLAVEPLPESLMDGEIAAKGRWNGVDLAAKAVLHPVPLARVPKLRRAPRLDSFAGDSWTGGALLEIGTNRLWQGRLADAADCSAQVRLAHDGRTLFVDVTVRDDVVVTNIAPDDIKGHWRSDSVEIAIDPAAGAEDTTGCFKIGIFPFDTTGRVRAARDADAKQGPVELTAPGLRLASVRTADGYRVRAAIPFALVVRHGRVPKRLGFNVLIYDGDKVNAALGENINESRLAWAPRSGVQGRPEDWGRIDLE